MTLEKFESTKKYLTIINGVLREKVKKETYGAVRRVYKIKDGKKPGKYKESEKYELMYKTLTGLIHNIKFEDGDFGQQMKIFFKDEVLTLPTNSRYFQDFAKKIMGADINEKIIISPFDFEADGRRLSGVTIYQNGFKLSNYYYDVQNKKVINGFPKPKGNVEKYTKDDWKIYFIEVKKFLIEEIETKLKPLIDPKLRENSTKRQEEETEEEPEEEYQQEIKLEDLPF